MPTITTALTNPSNQSITVGTLEFVSNTNYGTVLLGSRSSITPGTSINLNSGIYSVYYIDVQNQTTFVGNISVGTATAALASLLEAGNPSHLLQTNVGIHSISVNELKLTPLSSEPNNPTTGTIYLTSSYTLKVFNGNSWINL